MMTLTDAPVSSRPDTLSLFTICVANLLGDEVSAIKEQLKPRPGTPASYALNSTLLRTYTQPPLQLTTITCYATLDPDGAAICWVDGQLKMDGVAFTLIGSWNEASPDQLHLTCAIAPQEAVRRLTDLKTIGSYGGLQKTAKDQNIPGGEALSKLLDTFQVSALEMLLALDPPLSEEDLSESDTALQARAKAAQCAVASSLLILHLDNSSWEIKASNPQITLTDVTLRMVQLWESAGPFASGYEVSGRFELSKDPEITLLAAITLPEPSLSLALETTADPEETGLPVSSQQTAPAPQRTGVKLCDFLRAWQIPAEFLSDQLSLDRMSFSYEPASNNKSFALDVTGNWQIIPGILFEEVEMIGEITTVDGEVLSNILLNATLRFFNGTDDQFGMWFQAHRYSTGRTSALQFQGGVSPDAPIALGDLIDDLVSKIGIEFPLPHALHVLTISDLTTSLEITDSTTFDLAFTLGSAEGDWEVIPGLLSFQPAHLNLTIDHTPKQKPSTTISATITEVVTVLGMDWDVELTLANRDPKLVGKLALASEGYQIRPILDHFSLPADGMSNAMLSQATMSINGSTRQVDLQFSLEKLSLDDFSLTNVNFALAYASGQGGGLSASFDAQLSLGSAPNALVVDIAAVHPGPGFGWQFAGTLDNPNQWTLMNLATALNIPTGRLDNIGPQLTGAILTHLTVTYDTKTKRLTADGIFQLSDDVILTLSLNRIPQPSTSSLNGASQPSTPVTYEVRFEGTLTVKGLVFDLVLDHDGGGEYLIGAYAAAGGGPNPIPLLMNAVGMLSDTLADVSFKIKSALLVYSKAKIEKDSNTGRAKQNDKNSVDKVLFVIDMDAGIDLSGLGHLPLIGSVFAGDHQLNIAFTPLISSGEFDKKTVNDINKRLPAHVSPLPIDTTDSSVSNDKVVITKKVTVAAQVRLGGEPLHLLVDPAPDSSPIVLDSKHQGLGSPRDESSTTQLTRPADDVSWINVQKTLAKVLTLRRIGVGLHGERVIVLLDGAVAVAGLSLDLLGLGATYDFKERRLEFMLQGMSLAVQKGTLDVSAAFANINGDFVGLARITTEGFGLTAMGAFSEGDGHPSMFIYGILDYPIGGPVFFFVEGLALGFGFNRHLTLPAVADVATFPLVAEARAMGGSTPPAPAPTSFGDGKSTQASLTAELGKLAYTIYPSVGEYFLTVGLKFNSFRIIDVFALLTLQVNTKTERFLISLMGMATLIMPKDSPEVLLSVELGFVVTVDPIEGSVLAAAQLTGNSWVLSPNCHLTGGFAVGLWFLGDHAGDFVYTLGGYHPHFPVPAHYPAVPRLALLWNISDALKVKGDLYYALTPLAAMAGGHLNAVWDSDGLKAWFELDIDFLIVWEPFHYEGSAYIEIGAKYGLISGSVGADIQVRGPEFSGEVTFKLGPLHHTFSFGQYKASPAPISWAKFKQSFLPAGKGSTEVKILSLIVTKGLLNTLIDERGGTKETWWVVDPKYFMLTAATAVPFTQLRASKDSPPADVVDPNQLYSLIDPKDALPADFGVVPMNQFPLLDSSWTITVMHEKEGALSEFSITPTLKKFPASLWGRGEQTINSPSTLDLAGGVTLTPAHLPAAGATSEIVRKALDYTVEPVDVSADDSPISAYSATTFRTYAARQNDRKTIKQALGSGDVNQKRAALLQVLQLDAVSLVDDNAQLVDDFRLAPRIAIRTHCSS